MSKGIEIVCNSDNQCVIKDCAFTDGYHVREGTKDYRWIGWLALFLLALCFTGIARAATVTYSGTNPTKNTDGTDIPATGAGSLTTLRVEFGSCSAPGVFGTKAGEVSRTSPAAGANFTGSLNLQPGTSCVRIFVANTFGSESDPSNVAVRVVDPPKPMPPVLATVALAINVPLDSLDGFKRTLAMSITASGPGVPVGVVKLGTPSVGAPVFTWRNQAYCRFLLAHPVTGASNIAWIKGVSTTTDAAAPCA